MRTASFVLILGLLFFTPCKSFAQRDARVGLIAYEPEEGSVSWRSIHSLPVAGKIASDPLFTTPDTVCVNSSIVISGVEVNASNYNWSFCPTSSYNPTGFNLGNPGNSLTTPCFMEYVKVGENYYGFITSNNPPSLVRLDFGNSLLNKPKVTNLGDFGGILPYGAQGLQVVNDNGSSYAIVTGGDVVAVRTSTSRIVKIEFGPDIRNNNPVATDWGNVGYLNYPTGLLMFNEEGAWYGFTVNYYDGTITRFNFGRNFDRAPKAENLGNLGRMRLPNTLRAVNDQGNWHLFVVNYGNNTISRIDFGNSLLNTPVTEVNLGNVGGVLSKPRDLYFFKDCDGYTVFGLNEETNSLFKLSFNSITERPTGVLLDNTGSMDGPHSFSKVFREGSDLYAFVPNSWGNTITRLKFTDCVNPGSMEKTPPAFSYDTPGSYVISLKIDEGLPTERVYCRQIVVMPQLNPLPMQLVEVCAGASVKIGLPRQGGSYIWSTGEIGDSILVSTPGIYWVETTRGGCVVRDSFNVTMREGAEKDFLTINKNASSEKALRYLLVPAFVLIGMLAVRKPSRNRNRAA